MVHISDFGFGPLVFIAPREFPRALALLARRRRHVAVGDGLAVAATRRGRRAASQGLVPRALLRRRRDAPDRLLRRRGRPDCARTPRAAAARAVAFARSRGGPTDQPTRPLTPACARLARRRWPSAAASWWPAVRGRRVRGTRSRRCYLTTALPRARRLEVQRHDGEHHAAAERAERQRAAGVGGGASREARARPRELVPPRSRSPRRVVAASAQLSACRVSHFVCVCSPSRRRCARLPSCISRW